MVKLEEKLSPKQHILYKVKNYHQTSIVVNCFYFNGFNKI